MIILPAKSRADRMAEKLYEKGRKDVKRCIRIRKLIRRCIILSAIEDSGAGSI